MPANVSHAVLDARLCFTLKQERIGLLTYRPIFFGLSLAELARSGATRPGFSNLWIAGRDEDSVSHHATVAAVKLNRSSSSINAADQW
jgi:hypothetical protein